MTATGYTGANASGVAMPTSPLSFCNRPSSLRAIHITQAIAVALGLGCCTSAPQQSPYSTALAQHLNATGATVYGAHWCPHSGRQKNLFGSADATLPYIECATDGTPVQAQLCQSKGVTGYPTWEIDGVLYPGVYSLSGLAELSGFPPPP